MKKILSFLFVAVMLQACPPSAYAQTERTMTVDELFRLVETNSRSLRVAKSGVEAAAHGVEAAKSSRLPDIEASLTLTYNGNVVMMDRDFTDATAFSSPHFGNSFVLQAQQAIYTGGALTAGIRAAEIQRQMAENGVAATRGGQRFIAVSQYLELLKADNAIRVYESNIALTDKLIEDIRAKRSQGMALKNDITRYELQREELLLGLRRMRDSRSIMNHQLCNTLGLEQGETIRPDTTLMTLSPGESEHDWQTRAMLTSTEIRRAELSTMAAEQQLKLAKSELLPKLSVVAMDNFSGPYTYDIPPIDNNFNVWYVGVGVRYSLSSLFKSDKRVRQAGVALRESREAQQQVAESVDNRMNEAHTLYLQAFADLTTRRKSAQLARENYEVVSHRYLNGLALITDMTDASNVRLSAELDETNARIAIVFAYYRMKYVAGEMGIINN